MRELKCQWQEPVPQAELTHQLEKGEPSPVRTRNGVIIDFVSALEVIRQGVFESRIYAVVLDTETYQLSLKTLRGMRLVRPKAEAPTRGPRCRGCHEEQEYPCGECKPLVPPPGAAS